MTTITAGENFILSLSIKDDSDVDIPASDIKAFEIHAKDTAGKLLKAWKWTTAKPDPNIRIADGLVELEVASSLTAKWKGVIHFEIIPSFADADYFVAGAQTDVVCFDALLTVEPC